MTISDHDQPVSANLLQRRFTTPAFGRVAVAAALDNDQKVPNYAWTASPAGARERVGMEKHQR